MNVTLSLVTAPDRFNAEFLRVPNKNVIESHQELGDRVLIAGFYQPLNFNAINVFFFAFVQKQEKHSTFDKISEQTEPTEF